MQLPKKQEMPIMEFWKYCHSIKCWIKMEKKISLLLTTMWMKPYSNQVTMRKKNWLQATGATDYLIWTWNLPISLLVISRDWKKKVNMRLWKISAKKLSANWNCWKVMMKPRWSVTTKKIWERLIRLFMEHTKRLERRWSNRWIIP